MSESNGPTLERFRGCLLGLAVGDALGMPLEGMRASEIRRQFGRVRDFLAAPWRMLEAGQWTDDTKMALCQARSLASRGGFDLEDTAREFLAWYESRDWRGIGGATYDSMQRLKAGVPASASGMKGELAAGNGAAMRIAPLGLVDCLDLERMRAHVDASTRITHDNPEAVAGSLAIAYAVARASRGDLEPSLLIADTVAFVGPSKVAERLEMAGRFLEQRMEADEALARLGTGGYVVESVASAFFSFLRTPRDFEETLSLAVSGGLDTDTVAAMTGAISGAYNGLLSIPERWRNRVEAAEDILEIAARIYALVGA